MLLQVNKGHRKGQLVYTLFCTIWLHFCVVVIIQDALFEKLCELFFNYFIVFTDLRLEKLLRQIY